MFVGGAGSCFVCFFFCLGCVSVLVCVFLGGLEWSSLFFSPL